MAWIFLALAGTMEVGWPLGLKYAYQDGVFKPLPATAAVASIIASGVFLYLAQRTIPMGTAYAVWTGIGSVGTFALGILLFQEPANAARLVCAGLIVMGIVGLKLFSDH